MFSGVSSCRLHLVGSGSDDWVAAAELANPAGRQKKAVVSTEGFSVGCV
jgi:hypothetical protein